MTIDYDKIRQMMRLGLKDVADVPAQADWSRENEKFDPAGRKLWIKETLMIVDETKAANDLIALEGIMQYDVFVPANSGTAVTNKVSKQILKTYRPGVYLNDSGTNISIDKATPGTGGIEKDGWYQVSCFVYLRSYTHISAA